MLCRVQIKTDTHTLKTKMTFFVNSEGIFNLTKMNRLSKTRYIFSENGLGKVWRKYEKFYNSRSWYSPYQVVFINMGHILKWPYPMNHMLWILKYKWEKVTKLCGNFLNWSPTSQTCHQHRCNCESWSFSNKDPKDPIFDIFSVQKRFCVKYLSHILWPIIWY